MLYAVFVCLFVSNSRKKTTERIFLKILLEKEDCITCTLWESFASELGRSETQNTLTAE